MKQILPVLFFSLFSFVLTAQEGLVPAFELLRSRAEVLGVDRSDLAELRITDRYTSPSGVEHVYVEQLLFGTPVYNALSAVHFRDGGQPHYTAGYQTDIRRRAVAMVPVLTRAAAFLSIDPTPLTRLEEAGLTYFAATDDAPIHLCWRLVVEDTQAGTHVLHLVDAVNADLLYSTTLTVSCTFEGADAGAVTIPEYGPGPAALTPEDGSMYYVFPFGVESPNDGERQLEFEPADPVASPFGWHDTDGKIGAEYTLTRGNNVYAYRDQDTTNNTPDAGFEADGGQSLDFDFAFNPPQSADSVARASMVQLFYLTNKLHDWAYRHGFDAPSGNFQENNYDRRGRGNDALNAETHDVTGTNNANFYTPGDGKPPRMQMYLWKKGSLLTLNHPENLSGDYITGGATFGARIGPGAVTAEVALGLDASSQPGRGCEVLVNTAGVAGKIVLLDRGGCAFQLKAYHAEQAGAVGVIICNTENEVFTMGGSGSERVTVPAVIMRKRDCESVKKSLRSGVSVEASLQNNDNNPLDGTFDSGVVAHEYGHGISTRLVGGPSRVACLRNDEQMGEGWSDFFALASTPHSATARPTGAEARAIGVYSAGGDVGSRGFRSQFYSTDFSINNHTYDDVILAAVPHGIGEVWASTLWDIYWKMVDAYGFDPDLIEGKGGNNAAVRLVIEALKFTPCDPGMLDGRDALLVADRFENDGANQCLLWEVFQRRGLGLSAYQGDGKRRNDNREAFDVPPACIPTVKVTKSADTSVISASDPIVYTLTVSNHKQTGVSNITVSDELPAGISVKGASIGGGDHHELLANTLTFHIDSLEAGEERVITYTALSDPGLGSSRLFFDGAEGETGSMTAISTTGSSAWYRNDTMPHTGKLAWHVPNMGSQQDQVLQLTEPVTLIGTRPALRFFTSYLTEPAYDAGIVQVSTDSVNWENVDQKFLRYGYRGRISPRGTPGFRDTPTFWGDSRGYREAIIDLAAYAGQSIYVRWRFFSDGSTSASGWWVDDIELMSELVTYDGITTLTTAEGDRYTTRIKELGVVVNSGDFPNALIKRVPVNTSLRVFPNPAGATTTIELRAGATGKLHAAVFSLEGKLISRKQFDLLPGTNYLSLPLGKLVPGVYSLRLTEARAVTTVKLTVSR